MKTRLLIILAIVVIGVVISYGYFSNYIQNYNSEINKTKYLASQPTINVTGIIQHWKPIDGPSYSIIPEEDIDVEMNEYRGIFLYGKLNPSLEGKRVTISGILIENYADFHSKTLGGAFGGDPHTATILVENVFSSESDVTDSLKIPNAERDAKLDAGYKLYPGVGWVHPDDQGNQQPIYRDNPNNPGEFVLDLDAMIAHENLSLDVIDCNISDNPNKEYQCFREAFSNCQLAKVDPDQYTIEGSPIFTNVTITGDCKIYGIIDTTTDVHGDRGIITSTCETLTDDQYGWNIKDCDASNYPEMHFNYEMQLYTQILECEENGNTWVRENLECVVD